MRKAARDMDRLIKTSGIGYDKFFCPNIFLLISIYIFTSIHNKFYNIK
jgi:hypothetical protein